MGHACIFLYQLQEMFISVVGVYSLSEVTSVGIVKFLIDQRVVCFGTGFLNLTSVDLWGWMILCSGGLSCAVWGGLAASPPSAVKSW